MGTFLNLNISKVPSDSTIQELLKSVFGIFGNQKLTRLDSNHMCLTKVHIIKSFYCNVWFENMPNLGIQ